MAGLDPTIHVPDTSKWTAGEAKGRTALFLLVFAASGGDLGLVIETRGVVGRDTPDLIGGGRR
jgi:hypothetical protein